MQSVVVEQPTGKNIGSYQITRSLGRGALSTVYEACKGGVEPSFVVTTFHLPETLSSSARTNFLERFEREASLLTTLRNSYILPLQDYGEDNGLPYLVTPSIKGSSLKKLLRRKGSFTPLQVFELLKRVVDGFAYAHQHGVVHGTLNSSNILFGDSMQIAGFGLMRLLTAQGIEKSGALLSIAGTMLGTPGYVAPELLEGQPADARVDVYALGVLLLELLSGSFPFDETIVSPSRYVQAPRLSTLCLDLSMELETVIQQAVNPDPVQRIQSVKELLMLFEQACSTSSKPVQIVIGSQKTLHDRNTTLPNTVDWTEEENIFATGKWQGVSPIEMRGEGKSGSQKRPRIENSTDKSSYDAAREHDPFVWWSNMSATQVAAQQGTTTSTASKTAPRVPVAKKPMVQKQGRRKVVAMLAGGGVVALGALGFGGITLAHMLQNHPTATTNIAKPPLVTKGQPTKATQTHPTKGMTTQPAPPKHTGTVVGNTTLGVNTAQTFTNPKDGTGSILVHLPGGNFVAYNKACTHQGVTVHYDPATQKLVCPAHGSVFDPANGAMPIAGPAPAPLQAVSIHVNGDGTITVA